MGGNVGKKLNSQTIKQLQAEVDFSPEEIKSWFGEYRQSLRAGEKELTREEFKKVYNSLFVGDASEFAEQVFRTFDTDNSGTVDFKEFLVGLCVSGSSDTSTKLKWAFNMYDINEDGYICRDEMKHIVSAIYKMTEANVPAEVATPDLMTKKVFEEFDTNRDGLISWEEFQKGAVNEPVIVNLLECNPNPDET